MGRSLLGESEHTYKVHEAVPLYANKVGPFPNPSETYQYFDLPFCRPEGAVQLDWHAAMPRTR